MLILTSIILVYFIDEFTTPEQRVCARFADGKLLFKGDSFRKGENVYIDDKIESPWA